MVTEHLVLPADRGKVDRALAHYRDRIATVTQQRRDNTISDLDATTVEADALVEYAEVLTAKADWTAGKLTAVAMIDKWTDAEVEEFANTHDGTEFSHAEAAELAQELIEDIRHSLHQLQDDEMDVQVGLNWVMWTTGGLTWGDPPTDVAETWGALESGAPEGFAEKVLSAIGFITDWSNRLALLA